MFNKTVLLNGLRLITAPLPQTEAATILILYKVGSRYEAKELNGISHFIEHMMFKGTKKRPNTLAISKDLDSVGAEYNAFTGRDYTGYYIKIEAGKVELALDVLSDMLLNSKFENSKIKKEKGVICEEIRMYEDNPLMFIEDLFEELVYGTHPLGRRISGGVKDVNSFTREGILVYKEKFYEPNNSVLAMSGKFGEKEVGLVQKYFGAPAGKTKADFKKFIPGKIFAPKIKIQFRETEQVQLALGFPAYSYFDPKFYALKLLTIILGGYMSSRLFISIRVKKGLCYYIKSQANVYEDTGNLMIQSGLDKSRIFPAIKAIVDELKKIQHGGVTDVELKRAKECLKGKLILDLEDSSEVADWYAKQELLMKEILTPKERLEKFFAITKEEVQKVAQELIAKEKINLALIGPFKEEGKFLEILNSSFA